MPRLLRRSSPRHPVHILLLTGREPRAIFRLAVFSAAAQSRRKVRILHQLTQPADHPVNIYHPEGEYLKGLILYVE